MPYIAAPHDLEAAKRESLRLPEVQEAIKQGVDKLKEDKSWVTPQLLAALQSRPELLKGLSNPHVQQAMTLMQTNPEEAKARYANDPEVLAFMKEFSNLMATHFEVLGHGAGQAARKPPTVAAGASVAAGVCALEDARPSISSRPKKTPLYTENLLDEDPVTKALMDPKVADAFQDAEVQALLAELRAGRPLEMRDLCRERPQLFFKVKVLLDAGLLSMQQ